ncbi:hypothetical protein MS2017_1662 [Bathymodiolus thermophilus thioautotrophic gill symbiont]|uniref:Lipoprotein n=2 Tax=Bathymodiolus thermophilus thioautotrophic gill symbiont TaxID=2360 RepID=A0A1J5TVV2_9GAMM|nr:hypothetical protein [Bathymodiolus thermophilus thioautotrophic gill symbiont]AYQ57341.1 hypothetical protein MS2017_1662 [Bathymodiolus thermophilus thioautotrophic gill symbiont]OIR24960.1 hypothetical protein BGC33_05065 [Bathymodiolus thermophilus thioautotrophic gill symbiont]
MKFTISLAMASTIILTGCNRTSSEVIADYVDGYKLTSMSCSEIRNELSYLQQRANEAAGIVDEKGKSQDGKDIAAFLLFWPALFLIDDNKPEARRYAQIKGEYEAAKRAYSRKGCKNT